MLMNKESSLLLMIDVQEKLTPHVMNAQDLIEACQWLGRLAQTLSVPVLLSEQYPSGLGKTIAALQFMEAGANCISKISFSCMGEPDYVNYLKGLGKKHLILAGIETHVCVMQTAIDMKTQGFEVFVVVDAVSSRSSTDKKYALRRMEAMGIHLVTKEMVFFEWIKKAGGDNFKSLSKEFLQ